MFDLEFEDFGLGASVTARVRDVYAHADLGVFTGAVRNISVPLHGCAERFKSFLWLKKIETHYTMEAVLIISSTCEG